MTNHQGGEGRRYLAIVFKHFPTTPDFTRSDRIVLPGIHARQAAWDAVYAALKGPAGADLIGGTIEPLA